MKITELVLKRLVKDNFNDFICFEDSEFKTFGNVGWYTNIPVTKQNDTIIPKENSIKNL